MNDFRRFTWVPQHLTQDKLLVVFESQDLCFLIPPLDLLMDHSKSREEVSREQNKEAKAAHQDLALITE